MITIKTILKDKENSVKNKMVKSKAEAYIQMLDHEVNEYDLLKNEDIKIAYNNIKIELEKLITKL